VLGIAYKRDIDDMRESPALDVIRLLEERGAVVSYHDPHIPSFREDGRVRQGVALTADLLRALDAVVIVTDHTAIDYQLIVDEAPLVIDTRNATRGMRPRARVVSLSAPNTAHAAESLPGDRGERMAPARR
jgi:UDP-N-acetyl-D-glucosamine dehydrogenase